MKKNNRAAIAWVAAVLTGTTLAYAEDVPVATSAGTDLLLSFGVTYGGDKLATVEYQHGSDVDIRAGGLVLFGIGAVHRFDNNWEVQTSINYQVDRANARNGDATFDRMPIDLLGFYRVGPHRIGGGATYHLNPKFHSNFDFTNGKQSFKFDNALGAVIEYDYFFTEHVSLGLRYANIRYKSSDVDGSIDGSYGGLMLNGYFY